MSPPPLPQTPKKPSALASIILLCLILGAIAVVGGGGYWAYRTFLAKPGAPVVEAPPAATPPGTTPPILAIQDPVPSEPQENPATAPSEETPVPAENPPPAEPLPPDKPLIAETTPLVEMPPPAEEPAETETPAKTETPAEESAPAPADHPVDPGLPEAPTAAELNPDPVVPAEPVQTFEENAPEVAALKEDADRRIDEAPPEVYSDSDKQKVREAIRVARRLTKVATLQYGVGSVKLGGNEKKRLKDALLSREAEVLLSDPQAVFFMIGYADATGPSAVNRTISRQRASGVGEVLKSFNVPNKCYSVGIGTSTLISQEQQERNRAVEVWVVLP